MAFEFDSTGFLSSKIHELELEIQAQHADLFSRAKEINSDCHEILFSTDIRRNDGRSIIAFTLFMRALEHYQATILALGRGMIAASRVSLRAVVETVFKLSAIGKDEDAFKLFIAEDVAFRRKLIKKIQGNSHPVLDEARKAIASELVRDIEQKIQSTNAKALSTEDWSKRAGMHDWYLTCYPSLSKATHTQVRDLETYLKIGERGEIEEFLYAPSLDDVPFLVSNAAYLLLVGASACDNIFGSGCGKKIESHQIFIDNHLQSLEK